VLRHWDDVGVVVPDRTPSGRRDYSEEHLHRLRVLRACQGVGMSLPEIRQVLHRGEPERTGAIERRLHHIRTQRAQLEDAERFLMHVINCEHDLLTRCDSCTRYATSVPLR
jgi:MerR family transcriptional regulator, copper efflux regulator